ncbi:AmmeMemoRadiSam system radical SAM enzyme [Patescibacteria group bacterium]|nr:AmmeMemoRadiSam system radical SAM enzyme [Patescibacteria group bacterium]
MIRKIGAILFLIIIIFLVGFLIYGSEKNKDQIDFYPAKYYQTLGNKIVQCNLCPRKCILSPGEIGVCKARKNVDGELKTMVYNKVAAAHVDPIEKKPLYHFLPGTTAYSISTAGCNLQCKFCQNWQIAQVFPWEATSMEMSPQEVVDNALASNAKAIAYTYGEPTIFYEYMYDIAKLAHKNGLKNVVISAGYINPEPLQDLLEYIDAYKIDFKGFSPDFYKEMTLGELEPVLETMKIIKQSGTWLEIVNLVIPGENDNDENLKNLALWIKDNLGEDVPLHFLRFHPDYKLLNVPPTPINTLKKARQIALNAGLNYVYTGNIYDPDGSITYCPDSGDVAIKRQGFFLLDNNLDKNGYCSPDSQVPGIWQ